MTLNIEKNELPEKIIGYKALNSDFTNRYGFKFEIGKTYKIYNEVKFGNDGNGFHFVEILKIHLDILMQLMMILYLLK